MIAHIEEKKELVGVFKNAGAQRDRELELVNGHDFRSEADGLAVPYGVYDVQANRGTLFVATSYDTPGFAVDCVKKWPSPSRKTTHCPRGIARSRPPETELP